MEAIPELQTAAGLLYLMAVSWIAMNLSKFLNPSVPLDFVHLHISGLHIQLPIGQIAFPFLGTLIISLTVTRIKE